MIEDSHSLEANYGEKMIEFKVRFWTNDIAGTQGHILPKHCWPAGMVYASRNDSHGIKSSRTIPFNSLDEVQNAIEQAMTDVGIKVHENKGRVNKKKRVLGLHPGSMRMSDDFDAPLPDEFWFGKS